MYTYATPSAYLYFPFIVYLCVCVLYTLRLYIKYKQNTVSIHRKKEKKNEKKKRTKGIKAAIYFKSYNKHKYVVASNFYLDGIYRGVVFSFYIRNCNTASTDRTTTNTVLEYIYTLL